MPLVVSTKRAGAGDTAAVNTTSATLIVIQVSADTSTSAPTDNKGNTYSAAGGADQQSNSGRTRTYFCANPNVGSGHIFTLGGSFPSMVVAAFNGNSGTTSLDQSNGASAQASGGTPGSITPSEDNELVIAGMGGEGAGTVSYGSGFTLVDTVAYGSGVNYSSSLGYLEQTSAAAANPAISWTGGGASGLTIHSFECESAVGFTSSPTTVQRHYATNKVLTLTGTGTAWDGTTVFSLSGVTGVVKVSQNVTSATSATVTITTGTGHGTLTITESVTGTAEATVTVSRSWTSKADGNWATAGQTTWNEDSVPEDGDLVAISSPHDITVTADTVVGDGTASIVLSVEAGATLTVTGADLTIRGFAQIGNADAADTGAVVNRLTIQNSGATPGNVILDGNSGVTPLLRFGNDSKFTISGTSSARCSIRTKSMAEGDAADSDGENGILDHFDAGGFLYLRQLSCDLSYFRFHKIGDASNGWMACRMNFSSGVCNMSNGQIDTCGTPNWIMVADDSTTEVSDIVFSNSLDSVSAEIVADGPLTTGTRNFSRIFFDAPMGPMNVEDVNFQKCIFADGLTASAQAVNWAAMNKCVLHITDTFRMGGDVTNSFVLGNSGGDVGLLSNTYIDANFANNIMQAATGRVGCGDSAHNPDPKHFNVTGNLVILNSAGTACSGPLWSTAGTAFDTDEITHVFDHNTYIMKGSTDKQMVRLGLTSFDQFPESSICKNNLVVRLDALAGVYSVVGQDVDNPATTIVADCIRAVDCHNNAYYGLTPIAAGRWTAISGDTDVEAGTVYDSPMTGAVAPGANDVELSGSPFVDITRNIESWAVSRGSVAGTLAGKRDDAFAYLKADMDTMIDAMLDWISAGYNVTGEQGLLIQDAGDDNVTIGAGEFVASVSGQFLGLLGVGA